MNGFAIPPVLCQIPPMKFVCASSLTLGREVFESVGEVVELPESDITRDALSDADALIVRSKTRINAELLEGTPVSLLRRALGGDPIEIDVMGYALSLRKDEARKISIQLA